METSSRSGAYYRYFDRDQQEPQQTGGLLPTFVGSRRYQYGKGFGDILRGLLRRAFPVLLKGAATLLGETASARESGATIGEAVKAALKPAGKTLLAEGIQAVIRKREEDEAAAAQKQQEGSGSKRKRKHKVLYKEKRKQAKKAKRPRLSTSDKVFYNF